jgi:hypothetical protein
MERVKKSFRRDEFLETNTLQNTFSWIRVINKHFPGYGHERCFLWFRHDAI